MCIRDSPYRLPGGKIISPLSFVVADLIIYWAGWGTLWRLGFAILLGYVLLGSYAWYAIRKGLPDAPRLDFKAAQWLPGYLVGMGVISWLGGFGGGRGTIGLWWDMLVVAAFSLVVYYWAKATASRPEAIERSIDEVVVTDAPVH